MGKVLVFRVNFDLASSYMHFWMERVIDHARRKGYEVIDLSGANATLDNFLEALKEDPDLVVIGTHGDETRVVGDLASPLLNSCENDGVLAGRIVVYGACLAGQTLAKTTHDKGAPIVVGYLHEFAWSIDPHAASPEEDAVAAPFGDLYREPIFAVLDGLSPKEVYRRTMKKYDEVYEGIKQKPQLSAAVDTTLIGNDRDGLIIYGTEGVLAAPPHPVWPAYLLLAGAAGVLGLYFYKEWKRRERERWPPVGWSVERAKELGGR